MTTVVRTDPSIPRVKQGSFNLAQNAGTYDILTAVGDVLVEIEQVYVKTAAGGLTSAVISTTHATPKAVVASALMAAITIELIMTVVTSKFVLTNGQKIQGTIVGTGNAGLIYVIAKYTPLTAGATLS